MPDGPATMDPGSRTSLAAGALPLWLKIHGKLFRSGSESLEGQRLKHLARDVAAALPAYLAALLGKRRLLDGIEEVAIAARAQLQAVFLVQHALQRIRVPGLSRPERYALHDDDTVLAFDTFLVGDNDDWVRAINVAGPNLPSVHSGWIGWADINFFTPSESASSSLSW